jgi:glycerol-3-phosphate dehydrogenase
MKNSLPTRVRVLILGGGIHGVGILHDIASRGWKDALLVEKSTLGSGTSSKSTKLIHGGLRYLKNPADLGLVRESLHERKLLLTLAPDLVAPLQFYLPVFQGGMPGWMIGFGLTMYDKLAGNALIQKHHKVSFEEFAKEAPAIRVTNMKKVFSYWDAQTDDLALVKRVADSARLHGAQIAENMTAERVRQTEDGWEVFVRDRHNKVHMISALYVINALGPWANFFLTENHITPKIFGINNEGIHLLTKNLGFNAAILFQIPREGRIFFMIPWKGYTLIGTTEELYGGHPDALRIKDQKIQYLLDLANQHLVEPLSRQDILTEFTGLRWLPGGSGKELTQISRYPIVTEHKIHRGLLLTIYGGKLTTYRRLAEKVGDLVMSDFGEYRPSRTADPSFWKEPDHGRVPDAIERFETASRESLARRRARS